MNALDLDGLHLPVRDGGDGPVLDVGDDPLLAPLGWVVNAAARGAFPELLPAVRDGRDARAEGLSAERPAGRDVSAEASAWEGLTGTRPGADSYLLATVFLQARVLIPRATLTTLLEALLAPREHADALLDALEQEAAELEASGSASKRRFFLEELELLDPERELAGHPLLQGYRDAALERARYQASAARRAFIPEGGPAAVSLDWFRAGNPPPERDDDPDGWLAFCERSLRDADTGDAAHGVVYALSHGSWIAIEWRTDDGRTPVVVSARPR